MLAEVVNSEEIEVRAEADGWVVVPTNWDAGWRAWVNGREAPVLRANYVWQAVPVARGTSYVTLAYRPSGFGLGLALSSMSMAGLAILFVRAGRSPSCGDAPAQRGGSLRERTPTGDPNWRGTPGGGTGA